VVELCCEAIKVLGPGGTPRKLLKPGRLGSGNCGRKFFDTVLIRFAGMMFRKGIACLPTLSTPRCQRVVDRNQPSVSILQGTEVARLNAP
jgi:hypothetical protein